MGEMRVLVAFASLCATLVPAAASAKIEEPRRTDIDVRSPTSMIDLQGCIMRRMSKWGRSMPVPIDGGVALDFNYWSLISLPGEAKFAVEIVDLGSERKLSATYRHPTSAGKARRMFRDFTNGCLQEPAT